MSYNGRINFGLLGDYDAMHDLDEFADDLGHALGQLAEAAGVKLTRPTRTRAKRFDRVVTGATTSDGANGT
jgi:hypothetical protein